MRNRYLTLLALILLVSVVLRVALAFYLGDRVEVLPGIHDQLSYHELALSILAGKGYQFATAWYPFTPANTPTAHWSFLYPLYLAGIYFVFGVHPLAARIIQAIASGLLLPLLGYRLGSRLFGKAAGIASAGAMALYGYFIYHNAALMTETFYMVMVVAVFDVAYGIVDSGDRRRWWLLGLVMGLAVLLRQVYLFFVPVLLLWMATANRRNLSLRGVVLAVGIVVLLVLPWTWRNYERFGDFLLLNSNSGYAFYTSVHPAHGDTWDENFVAPIPDDLAGAPEAEIDRALTSRALGFILADPERFVKLTLTKIPYHFRFWPTPGSRPISELIRFLSFGLYLPFMLAGLVLSRHQWWRLIPIYLFALMMIAIHVLSWPSPRYRFPVDAVFMVFVGLAVSRALEWLRKARSASYRAAVEDTSR